MSGTNWAIIIGVVVLIVIGFWYYSSSPGSDSVSTPEAAIEAPAATEAPAEPATDGTAEPAAN